MAEIAMACRGVANGIIKERRASCRRIVIEAGNEKMRYAAQRVVVWYAAGDFLNSHRRASVPRISN
jgi:hypothetical protein